MNNLPFDVEHLLEDTKAVLEDLRESEMRLHSSHPPVTTGPSARAAITLSSHLPATDAPSRAKAQMASYLAESQSLMKEFSDASEQKRTEIWAAPAQRMKLYSIIFAEYRPAPTFRAGHSLLDTDLNARICPGGPTWWSLVRNLPVATWARHAVRLDNAAHQHKGSGTLTTDGRILTAWHVIDRPGYALGEPPNQNTDGLARCNNLPGGPALDFKIRGYNRVATLDACWIQSSQAWPEVLAGSEFSANVGLRLQETALTAAELVKRKVAVIGHPGAPITAEDAGVMIGGGDGAKRFMPGTLHPTEPLGSANGIEYLRHDCSTLQGTSGGCLVDLLTGVILGVHVSGKSSTEKRNGAVPAWLIAQAAAAIPL